MMLSRVAERMYWGARYLERSENTARLVRVYDAFLLDVPAETGAGWRLLLDITGNKGLFSARYPKPSDRATLKFLLADPDNPGSLLASLAAARENFRTTRDLAPSEAWRCINELYLASRRSLGRAIHPRHRQETMSDVVERVQQLAGLLSGTMSHGDAYQFICIGRGLERADMTSRIIDAAAATLMSGREELARFQNALWMAVLKSLSAYQMYRQSVRRRILGPDVVGFLLGDPLFPRAIAHCLEEIAASMRGLPRNDAPLRAVLRLKRILEERREAWADEAALHRLLDELQADLAGVHDQVVATWFLPEAGP